MIQVRLIQIMDIIYIETGFGNYSTKRDKRIRDGVLVDGGYDALNFLRCATKTDAFQGKDLHEVTYLGTRLSLMVWLVGQSLGKCSGNVL